MFFERRHFKLAVSAAALVALLSYLVSPDLDPEERLLLVAATAIVGWLVARRLPPRKAPGPKFVNVVVFWDDPRPLDEKTKTMIHYLIEARVFEPGTTLLNRVKLNSLLASLPDSPESMARQRYASHFATTLH